MSAKQNLTVEVEIANPKEQAVSDAMDELVARSIGPMRSALADGYDDETALRTAFEWAGIEALLTASAHPLEQQQAVSGDVVERAAEPRNAAELLASDPDLARRVGYERQILAAQVDAMRRVNGVLAWLKRCIRHARYTPDAIDHAAADTMENIAKHIEDEFADFGDDSARAALTASGMGRMRERNRLMGDVIDFACDHIDQASDAMDFIEAYRSDEWDHYPNFVKWRELQARTALQEDGRDD